MLICLEGVDGSGKTTLANDLSSYFRCDVTKFDITDTDIFLKYMNLVSLNTYNVAIMDRCFITDLVYRMVDDKPMTSMFLDQMLLILSHCIIIHCDNDQAFRKSIERGEDNITDSSVSQKIRETYNFIYKMFDKFLSPDKFKFMKYNYLENDFMEVVGFIEKVCDEKGVLPYGIE